MDIDNDLIVGEEYAVSFEAKGGRPLRGVWDGISMTVFYPDSLGGKIVPLAEELTVLGRWSDKTHPVFGESSMTWQGLAKQTYGQVLRQHDLVRRLANFGIIRLPEPYVIEDGSPNSVERSLVLTYDELDRLLTAAED